MNRLTVASRVVLIIMGILFIFGCTYSYLGLDVPPLYKAGKSVRAESYRQDHHGRRSGFYYYGGGGLHGGK